MSRERPVRSPGAAPPVTEVARQVPEDALTVAEVGEDALIAAFAPLLPPSPAALVGNGDDCAVLATADGRTCVSTDVLVEGHHFRLDWSGPEQVGERAAAQNLADAASMGARPVALVVSLVLPPTTSVGWVRGLARGLARGCARCGAGVVGGDLSAGDGVVVAVTVIGDLEGRAPVLRDGARPGDLVVHVGGPGRSAAGLALLAAGIDEEVLGGVRSTDDVAPGLPVVGQCLRLYRAPEPPLSAGPALARAGATAMMDVSDSLLRDAGRLARASGVVLDLDDPVVPGTALEADVAALAPVATLLRGMGSPPGRDGESSGAGSGDLACQDATSTTGVTGVDGSLRDRTAARTWVLTGGEDHGMLATVPAHAVGRLPEGARVIGRVRTAAPGGAPAVLVAGRPPGRDLGWDHFRR